MNPALVAKIMCTVTEDLLWKPRIGWAKKHNPTADLVLRVGTGKKTYLSHQRDVDHNARMTLTYGSQMVADKARPERLGLWRSGREVKERGYYGGELTLLNVLAHTMAHEFGHFVQVILGRRYSGSVHNDEFYQILDRIHGGSDGEKIRTALHQRCLAHSINLQEIAASAQPTAEQPLTFKDVRLHQELWFRDPKLHRHNPVRVKEKRRTRIVVASVANPELSWSASPSLLSEMPTA